MKKKNKKQIIREAAAKLFREKGYAATSMRDLARAVNLEASSLYNHIGSKSGLLRDICFENARFYLLNMDKIEKTEASASEKLEALLRLHIHIATEDPTSVMSFNDEWRHLPEPDLSEFKQLRKEYEGRFRRIIEAGMASGAFKPGHSGVALYTLLSSVRWLHDWYKPNKTIEPEQIKQEIVQILLQGINN